MNSDTKNWRKAILSDDATIQQAIRNLVDSSTRIILVIAESEEFVGTISDGDIRRALLRGLDLNSSIASVIHRNALVVPPEMARETVLQLMVANKIQQIPIVDSRQRLVGLHLWEEMATVPTRGNLMVIMAGGRGTRLLPHTENCPKPMVLVSGKPILEHIIERGKLEGFSNFVLAIHHLGHVIERHFGNGDRLGVKIQYLREQSPLGTAGALNLLNPRPDAAIVVTNGDLISDIHYGELLDFHNRYQADGTMAVRIHEWQHPFGVVQTRGVEIVGFEEKPVARTHINAGVYTLSPDALDQLLPGSPCDMPALFERLQEKSMRIVAYPMHEPWLDVGRPDDLAEANKR